MKQLLFVLVAALGSITVTAQKDFEGKIVYQLEASMDEKKPELTVCFAPGKLKLTFKEGDEPDNTYVLVLMDSAKIFNINTDNRTYKAKKMNVRSLTPFTSEKKTIAGYPTTSAKNESNSPSNSLGGLITLQDMIVDVADNLTFTIPDNMMGNPEFLMIRNNHIVLGATMKMATAFSAMGDDSDGADDESTKKIFAKALSVTPMTFTADEFAIPEGYTPQAKYAYGEADSTTIAAMDTAVVAMVDSVAVPYKAPKKPAKKPAKKSTGKKPATKSAAYRKP